MEIGEKKADLIPKEIRELVLENLKKIEEKNSIKILICVEIGSRAWGISSPTSDFVIIKNIKKKKNNEKKKIKKN